MGLLLPRQFHSSYSERVTLPNGMAAVLRLVRPGDEALLRGGFERLSLESRYARFFEPKTRLSDHELHYLTATDDEMHLAIAAVAEPTGSGIGVARFIRTAGTTEADAAVTIVDEVQHLGLGRILFRRLCAAAQERGIERFRCDVLAHNIRMQRLLETIGADVVVKAEAGTMRYSLRVSPTDEPVPRQ
jgi:RimJ/RimL family protein N-acetyltransferase